MNKPESQRKAAAFLRAAEAFGTLSFAARRMHMSQAEFLAQLQTLEEQVGSPLIEVGETLVLTASAHRFLLSEHRY